ncbi:hypothetical protein [Noviherbaspirillum pedocola]|uniref:Uncharacterized protein n=1 Tax=Noviherbaspirillum pedocola TaxID=2801341 RepID=A0A934SX85_9BURK|nr:hypothetical protein [Noviherbaspirillum pedocola]MBK4738225.1 hypothetical protein [Noviherbaspirillum pedocola]
MPPMSGKLPELLQHQAAVAGNTQREEFISQAKAALEQARVTGLGYDADAVYAYIRERVARKQTSRPAAIKWRV